MDFHLKQWRNQHEESGQQPSAKMPKLLMDPHQPQQHPHSSGSAAFPLFLPEPSCKTSNLSAFPDSNTAANTRLPKIMGNYFSLEQWQELELQALIYRFMLAGAAIPPELLQPIKKTLLHSHSPPYFLHHPLQLHCSYYQPSLRSIANRVLGKSSHGSGARSVPENRWEEMAVLQRRGGRAQVLRAPLAPWPQPFKKACGKPTPTISTNITCIGIGGAGGTASAAAFNCSTTPTISEVVNETHFSHTLESPSIHLNHSSETESKGLIGPPPPNEVGNRSDGHILWHFFDDWPRSVDESDNMNAGSSMNSLTCLSVSMPGNSPASDVSLKLSTGNNIAEEEPEPVPAPIPRGNTSNWAAAGWGTKITNQVVTSMGGPLAEALRSSTTKLISHECSAPVISPHCF